MRMTDSENKANGLIAELYRLGKTDGETALMFFDQNQRRAFEMLNPPNAETGTVIETVPDGCPEEHKQASNLLQILDNQLGRTLAFENFMQDIFQGCCIDDVALVLMSRANVDARLDQCSLAAIGVLQDFYSIEGEPSQEMADFTRIYRGQYDTLLDAGTAVIIPSEAVIPDLSPFCNEESQIAFDG